MRSLDGDGCQIEYARRGMVFALYIGGDKHSLLWSVTWCFLCVHAQSESLCLGLLTVSDGCEMAVREQLLGVNAHNSSIVKQVNFLGGRRCIFDDC